MAVAGARVADGSTTRTLLVLTLVAAVLWHAMSVAAIVGTTGTTGRDFATPYYAARVALAGGNPYDRAALTKAATTERTRTSVAPLHTPPPSLGLGIWSAGLPLDRGWQVFVGLQELALALALGALWRWWKPLGPAAGTLAVVVFAVGSAVPLALRAGRGNLLLLLIAIVAAWQHAEGRRQVGGGLVGLGAAVNPVLGVIAVPWVVQRQWRTVALAVVAFLAAHVAVVPLVGLDTIARYYGTVAPDLLRGDWTGAATRVGAVENHAIVGALVPDRRVPLELALAQLLLGAAVLTALGWAYRRPTTDPLVATARVASLLLVALLVATITLDQHLVLALPGIAAAVAAVAYGRLDGRWAVPLGIVAATLLYPTKQVGDFVRTVLEPGLPVLAPLVAESTTLALVVLLVATARLGAAR